MHTASCCCLGENPYNFRSIILVKEVGPPSRVESQMVILEGVIQTSGPQVKGGTSILSHACTSWPWVPGKVWDGSQY